MTFPFPLAYPFHLMDAPPPCIIRTTCHLQTCFVFSFPFSRSPYQALLILCHILSQFALPLTFQTIADRKKALRAPQRHDLDEYAIVLFRECCQVNTVSRGRWHYWQAQLLLYNCHHHRWFFIWNVIKTTLRDPCSNHEKLQQQVIFSVVRGSFWLTEINKSSSNKLLPINQPRIAS